MAKRKVVLKLSMENNEKRSKALKCATKLLNIVSVSLEGDKITVVGDGVDPVKLTTLMRKKMGFVELLTVTPVEEKK